VPRRGKRLNQVLLLALSGGGSDGFPLSGDEARDPLVSLVRRLALVTVHSRITLLPAQCPVVQVDERLSPGTKTEFEFKLCFCFEERVTGETVVRASAAVRPTLSG